MSAKLVDIFEKHSFGDPHILKEDYYIPAPSKREYMELNETTLGNPHSYFENSIDFDDDLDDDLLDDEFDLDYPPPVQENRQDSAFN